MCIRDSSNFLWVIVNLSNILFLMKKFLFLFIIFIIQNFYSQDKKIDSLLTLTKTSSLTKQAKLFNDISDYYKNYDLDKMQLYCLLYTSRCV